MKRTGGRAALRSVLLGLLLSVWALPAGAEAKAPPLQALELVERIELQTPAGFGLISGGSPELAPDERHMMIRLSDPDGNEQQAITRLDGSGFRCLTCGFVPSASKAKFFDDEKRIFFGNTSGSTGGNTANFQWSVLECAPSVYDCASGEVLPVDFPVPGLPLAQNREADPEVGGGWIGWNEVRTVDGPRITIGRLVRGDGAYSIEDTRVVNPAFSTSGGVDDFVAGGRFYEGGDQVMGGRWFKYQTTSTALNYDTWLLDLKTGKRTPLTTDLDYNEIASYSDDGRWAYYSSARGLDRMDVFTQLVRPPFIDMVSFGQVGRVSLSSNRQCMNEGWLMSRKHGQRLGGYAGQPTLLEEDWSLRGWNWFSNGKRALVSESLIPNREEPSDPARRERISIVRLPGIDPRAPQPELTLDELPWQQWTTPAAQYQGMAAQQIAAKVIHGKHSGTATLNFTGAFALGAWSVAFDNYSDDGKSFIDGTESLATPNPILASTYLADLELSGESTGYMRANLSVGPGNASNGTVESEVDGRHLEGIPRQDDCPGLRQPRLRILQRGSGLRRVRVRVTSRVPEDSRLRPVEAVAVRVGPRARARLGRGGKATTDHRGRATLPLPGGRSRVQVRATSDGFRPARLVIDRRG